MYAYVTWQIRHVTLFISYSKMRNVTHMNESRHICMSRIWMSHVTYATWLIHLCRDWFVFVGTYSCVWHDSFIHTGHDSFICDSCVCDMAHSYVWHSLCICDMTHSSVTWLMHIWQDSFIRVTWLIHLHRTWLIHTCDMTHSCVWHDSFIHIWHG